MQSDEPPVYWPSVHSFRDIAGIGAAVWWERGDDPGYRTLRVGSNDTLKWMEADYSPDTKQDIEELLAAEEAQLTHELSTGQISPEQYDEALRLTREAVSFEMAWYYGDATAALDAFARRMR